MKTKLIATITMMLFALMLTAPVMAKPTTFTVPYNQAQFQWRAAPWGGPFGDWSYTYQNWATSSDYTLDGNALHTTISYSPSAIDLHGASTVYVYDKKSDLWIQHEGTVSYTSPYSFLPITEYWRGYLKFSGNPSETLFVHGVGYQWGYVYGVDEATVKASYPNAVWDARMGAWLVGFSIYIWDKTTTTQDYLETVTVPANSPTGTTSTMTLTNGVQYELKAHGTWTNDGLNVADAEYASVDGWTTYIDGYNIAPYFLGEGEFDLQVGGSFVNWGAYSSAHTYTLEYVGTGVSVNFRIFDGDSTTASPVPSWYGDNSGSLTVDIYISFPSPFIEPVPANNYNPLSL